MSFKPFVRRNRALQLGFVPLTDCAPIVMAQELGLFERHGLNVSLSRELGWASVRDKIVTGELHAAQAVAGMPLAVTLGIGSLPVDCVTSLVLNLHGNAITISSELWRRGVQDATALRNFLRNSGTQRRVTFGVVFPTASHNFLLRRWLAEAGIDPDEDVKIVVVPPPQMPDAMAAGHIDGFCVGEPWNTVAIRAGIGKCTAVSAELSPGHPEKLLVVRRDFAESSAEEHETLIAALLDAAAFCSQPHNHPVIIEVLARREYLGLNPDLLAPALSGCFDFGWGEPRIIKDFVVFEGRQAGGPNAEKAAWIVNQMRAAGILDAKTELSARDAAEIFRADIFENACALRPALIKKHTYDKTARVLAVA